MELAADKAKPSQQKQAYGRGLQDLNMGIFQIGFIILLIISVLYLLSFWLISKKGDAEKLSPYENGFNPIGDARMKFDIIYWIIGLLYLIFDLEIVFIFPFTSIFNEINSLYALWAFMSFLIFLGIGFIYEYLAGALNIIE